MNIVLCIRRSVIFCFVNLWKIVISYLTICGLFEYSLSVLMHGNCSKSKILDSFNRLTHILLLDYFGAVNLTSSLNNFRL